MKTTLWEAMLPTLPLLLYVAAGALTFLVFGARRYRDDAIAARSSGATTKTMRLFFSWLMAPWLRLLLRTGIPANAITSLSLSLSLAAGVALAAGEFSLGGTLFACASVCDYFDGQLARRQSQGHGTAFGAALDSIVDRYSEVALLTGLCWYYRSSWVLVPTLFALTGSLLVPYARAKAESLGQRLETVGLLQRPERAVILTMSTGFAPLVDFLLSDSPAVHQIHPLAVIGVCLLAVGTQMTAAERVRRLLLALSPTRNANSFRSGSRALVSSAVATASDATLVILLSASFHLNLPGATILGCALGAAINFTLNRHWAFDAGGGSMHLQAGRYVLVSGTSALLSAGGVATMALLQAVPGPFSWLVARAVVFLTWTLPLFRSYVFQTPSVISRAAVADPAVSAASASAPTPSALTPSALTPSAPNPSLPTRSAPNPSAPSWPNIQGEL